MGDVSGNGVYAGAFAIAIAGGGVDVAGVSGGNTGGIIVIAAAVGVSVDGVSGVGLHNRSWGRRGLHLLNGWGWPFWLVQVTSNKL